MEIDKQSLRMAFDEYNASAKKLCEEYSRDIAPALDEWLEKDKPLDAELDAMSETFGAELTSMQVQAEAKQKQAATDAWNRYKSAIAELDRQQQVEISAIETASDIPAESDVKEMIQPMVDSAAEWRRERNVCGMADQAASNFAYSGGVIVNAEQELDAFANAIQRYYNSLRKSRLYKLEDKYKALRMQADEDQTKEVLQVKEQNQNAIDAFMRSHLEARKPLQEERKALHTAFKTSIKEREAVFHRARKELRAAFIWRLAVIFGIDPESELVQTSVKKGE